MTAPESGPTRDTDDSPSDSTGETAQDSSSGSTGETAQDSSSGSTGETSQNPRTEGGEPDSYDDIGHGLLEAEMGPSSSLAHLYRGEIHRMKFWRERLDNTTRWAVIIMAAILTWTFASPNNPHYLLLFAAVELLLFGGIEAHRFRGYDVWRTRVRILQRNVFAPGLDPDGDPPEAGWRQRLGDHYRRPEVFIPFEEAFAHRLRRIYLPQLGLVFTAWVVRVTIYQPSAPWPESAAIGHVPGTLVTSLVGLVAFVTLIIAFRPRNWHADREVSAEGL